MQTTLKPPIGMDIKSLIRLQGAEKSSGEFTPSQSHIYLPSEYERKQIIKWIEHFTGLKVDKRFMNIEMEFISKQKVSEILTRQTIQALEKINIDPDVRMNLIEGAKADAQKNRVGFFGHSGTNCYLVKERIEEIFKGICDRTSIKTDSPQVQKRKEGYTLNAYMHELLHKIITESSPALDNYRLKHMVEFAIIMSEYAKVKDKDPAKAEALTHKIEEISEKKDTFLTYDEAIAHSVSRKVMNKLGHSSMATVLFESAKETEPVFLRGLAFLQAIERKTGKNPIAYTINHPPTKPEHIDNPDKYLKDRKEGKI